MNNLFIMDPLDKIQVKGDSTYSLMLEAQKRYNSVYMCTPQELFSKNGNVFGNITKLNVSKKEPYFSMIERKEIGLSYFDVIWLRKDPPFDISYIFTTYLLDLVPKKTLILNNPTAVRTANEKMIALHWSQFCPPTLVTHEIERALSWSSQQPGQVVIKPWDGNGGRGVLVSHFDDPNFRSMLELLTNNGQEYILVQRYIPEIKEGDKRIILINGDPVGWMTRIPSEKDHRGNMHVGATVASFELSARDKEICASLKDYLKNNDLLFVGIDIIGDFLTEINVTSPTGIQEINSLMNCCIEELIFNSVESKLSKT
ncbi:MAG: glutathione synthase [Proteobacteria bacterium]|nr:glutathione synthase [Pseudomonadota bacterium]